MMKPIEIEKNNRERCWTNVEQIANRLKRNFEQKFHKFETQFKESETYRNKFQLMQQLIKWNKQTKQKLESIQRTITMLRSFEK